MTDERKARLKALAARAGRSREPADEFDGATEDKTGTDTSETIGKPNIVFRNYAPRDGSLSIQQRQSDEAEAEADSARPSASKRLRMQENLSSDKTSSSKALEIALQEAQRDRFESMSATKNDTKSPTENNHAMATITTITSVAPKKINWDLKRDIKEKLAKLERRTQKAIVKILKQRLELEAARAVNESVGDEDDLDLD